MRLLVSVLVAASSLRPVLAGGTHGAVASEDSQCARIGIDLLDRGGSAADAIVGTVFCTGVKNMYHSGVGGGGFGIVRAGNDTEFVDFRETAPAAAFQDMYKNNTQASIYGGLASGVPGELRGMWHMHQKYGKLPWKDVVHPAVKVARGGFRVNEDLVNYIRSALSGKSRNFLVEDPSWAIDFAPTGKLVQLGDTLYRKRYADTLEAIAERGPDAFYSGAIAQATIAALKQANGTMTLDDLRNYTIALRKPAQINYRDYVMHSCSAPAGGTVALTMLKTLEGYSDIGEASAINMSTFRLNEAMRFAYGQRANLGDPSFLAALEDYQDDMLSDATAAEVRSKITDQTHNNISYYNPANLQTFTERFSSFNPLVLDNGTSEIVASDGHLTISLTTTVNLLFGSQLMVPETGVIMNNEMNDFSIPGTTNAFGYAPSEANFIRPGKRPLSSISPVIVSHAGNGSLLLATGAAGGSRITTATAQNVWHVVDQRMSIAAALAMPRLHDQLSPNEASLEYGSAQVQGYNNQTAAFLRERGVNVTYIVPGSSTAQGLTRRFDGVFEAASEPRQINSGGYTL